VEKAAESRREAFRDAMLAKAYISGAREILETHFAMMPPRYWARVDAATLEWHVEVLCAFFDRLDTIGPEAALPVVKWRHIPERGYTEIAICTWDRLGLLARVAGALAEVGINILRADIYTRTDDVVLDLFHVCDGATGNVCDENRLARMVRLLSSLFDPKRELAAMNLGCFLPFVGISNVGNNPEEKIPLLKWDLEMSEEHTVLEVEAHDRLGLLYGIFRVLADCDLSVAQAVVTTEDGVAGDVFFLTDRKGRKITDGKFIHEVSMRLFAVLD
jgi:[protein-PII] uridylyltransferase